VVGPGEPDEVDVVAGVAQGTREPLRLPCRASRGLVRSQPLGSAWAPRRPATVITMAPTEFASQRSFVTAHRVRMNGSNLRM
jgi:hypothetical protein